MIPSNEPNEPEVQPTTSIRVYTPDGTMFVHVTEINGAPRNVRLNIGKVGTPIAAWADALGRVISLCLRSGLDIYAVIAEVSNISTAQVAQTKGVSVRSGPEGLAFGLLKYTHAKQEGVEDSDYRPPRMDG